ncbi:hypothetical protein IEQ44_16615 [Nocardioides sp. Y6]|uniref:Uncharacterized protein n=1 Tax=Nocardioides malaquae TaxID=2773426 RepID=A0ABR9RYG4_9ACTN|nr:hypothetical protein [Nocardioides malaquae]
MRGGVRGAHHHGPLLVRVVLVLMMMLLPLPQVIGQILPLLLLLLERQVLEFLCALF